MRIGSRLFLLATVLGIAHQSMGEGVHSSTADRRVIIGKRILEWMKECPSLHKQAEIQELATSLLKSQAEIKQRSADDNCERKYQNVESKLKTVKLLSDAEVKGALHDLQQCKRASLVSAEEDQLALQSLQDEMAREAKEVILKCPAQLEKISALLSADAH